MLPRFAITIAPLEDGFALTEPALCVLTERQFHPERAPGVRRRKRSGRDPETIIRDLGELAVGAPIVHEDHGVGRYRGLITLDAGGERAEYLEIEYAKGDKLYVPVAQLHLVNRYSGASPETAPLHSLGGEQWAKAKKKAAERVHDVAAELLEIQARRHARVGLAIAVDRAMYEPFAASFPFEETPDQLQAIEAVISDLAKPQPMDRVVCGDVGFGKTEVALRAAFVAATGGRQVAVLVPTTLLAQQHGGNFKDRFADWPIRVEVISRFRSSAEIKAVLNALADGKVDVIVGTHRLLQNDVKFKNLGLVIVDEEQRFGVQQKEALKKLRAEVNLLTLTATPIPRTLNMAMAGLRELSLIATAPAHRLAVKTFLTPWDPALLKEAFQREIARGGQIYFLHNQVESIERMARTLSELMPEARIRVGHGQMPERELEQVMLDFQRQRFNVLLCTTIIESGIDIPNANTIIIDRADRFGLAQLHQLRGRVGRSHHRAYAYLVVPDRKSMTGDAAKRLEAIASLDELGAGFTLATHDMEIRGAGELLGAEQSGQIAEIGFSLYTELLERAVRSMRDGQLPDLDADATPRRGDRAAHPRPDSRGLPAGRAHAPDPLQAHRERARYRRAARIAGRDDRPLRPAARSDQAPVRGRRTAPGRDTAGHPQDRPRRKRRPRAVHREAEHRSDVGDPDDPEAAEDLRARRAGQAEDQAGDAGCGGAAGDCARVVADAGDAELAGAHASGRKRKAQQGSIIPSRSGTSPITGTAIEFRYEGFQGFGKRRVLMGLHQPSWIGSAWTFGPTRDAAIARPISGKTIAWVCALALTLPLLVAAITDAIAEFARIDRPRASSRCSSCTR